MAKEGAPKKLIVNGKRLDGRGLSDFRKMYVETGILERATGSGSFSFGNTKAIAAVHGPREAHPRRLQEPQRAILRCKYFMAPFSTTERIRPGHSRRGTEISKVITEALENAVFLADFPKTAIDVFIEILQADASTRCAGLNAATIALADAGVPMRNLVSSCAIGKIDGKLVADVYGIEDNFGDVDFAIATVGGSDQFVLMQMDGVVTRKEFSKMLKMAEDGCKKVYKEQQTALRRKYATKSTGVENDE